MLRSIAQKVKQNFNARFAKFLSRRMPPQAKTVLSNKNVFILPTKFGAAFIVFVLLLFLLGTNYQNNVIILFSYLLGSFFVTSMLHTFYNLSALSLKQVGDIDGFVGESLHFPVVLNSSRPRFNLHFNLHGQGVTQLIDFVDEETSVQIPFTSESRGTMSLGRLRVSSEFSYGLFKAWTQIEFRSQATVYPKPIPLTQGYKLSDVVTPTKDGEDGRFSDHKPGVDDFYALKTYQVGEPLSHVAWKQVARKKGWYTKDYRENETRDLYLNLQDMPANNIERQLSMLCFLVLELHQQGQTFGIKLRDKVINANNGQQHLQECLVALAHFNSRELNDRELNSSEPNNQEVNQSVMETKS